MGNLYFGCSRLGNFGIHEGRKKVGTTRPRVPHAHFDFRKPFPSQKFFGKPSRLEALYPVESERGLAIGKTGSFGVYRRLVHQHCKVLEKTTYASPEVIAAAEKMNLVALQVDMTKFRDTEKLLLDHYGGSALPYAVLLDQKGQTVQTFSGMFSAESLEKAILHQEQSVGEVWSPQEGLSLIGKPAPEWKDIQWIQGGPLTLKDLRGKVVLLRFWLTGCPYCIATAPALNEFHEKYHDKGFVVVGLHHPKSEQAKNPDTVREAIQKLGFHFPIGMDNFWETIHAYGVGSEFKNFTSVSFVIDQEGIIRFVHDGGEFYRTTDPKHTEHQKAFFAIDNLILKLTSGHRPFSSRPKEELLCPQ